MSKRDETMEKLNLQQTLSTLVKAIRVSLRIKSKPSLVVSLLGFVMAFAPVISASLYRQFVDQVQEVAQRTIPSAAAAWLFGGLAGILLLQIIFQFVQNYYATLDTVRTKQYLRETIIAVCCGVRYRYIEGDDGFKERIHFAWQHAGEVVAKSMQSILLWLQTFVLSVNLIWLLAVLNPWILLLLLATGIPSVLIAAKHNDEQYRFRARNMANGALILHWSFEIASDVAMYEIRFFGLFPYLKGYWRRIVDNFIEEKNKMTRRHVLINAVVDVLRNGVLAVVLFWAAVDIYKNPALGLGTFLLIFSLAEQLQKAIAKLLIGGATFLADLIYMRDFFSLEELEYEAATSNEVDITCADIELKNVRFTYPGAKSPALNGLTVRIKQGEKVAVVGENGSGKTTFVNLLCGIYDPGEGSVCVGRLSVGEHLLAVRKALSAVFQDFVRYEATLRENLTIGASQRDIDDVELLELCRQTGVDEIVNTQPNGLDEMLGTFSEHGNNLSRGQWQKIAITRALYRDNAKVLILDEPTAALDPLAEAALYRDFSALTGDKTTILISHRLGITSVVDRILVFKDGQIIEDGNHQALMQRDGEYAAMYRAQAQWYVTEKEASL